MCIALLFRDTSLRDFYIMTLVIGKPDLEFRQKGIQQLRGPNFILLKSSASLAKIYHRLYINAVKSKLESSFVVGILPAKQTAIPKTSSFSGRNSEFFKDSSRIPIRIPSKFYEETPLPNIKAIDLGRSIASF